MSSGRLLDSSSRTRARAHTQQGVSAASDAVPAFQCLHSRGHAHRALRPEKLVFASEAEEAPLKLLPVGLGVNHLLPTAPPYCGKPSPRCPRSVRQDTVRAAARQGTEK